MRSEKISKRIITAMLAGTMLLTAAMTGCGGENSSGSNNTPAGTSAVSETGKETYKAPEYTLGEIVDSGTCGDNAKWQLDENGLLVISGSGEMDTYLNDLLMGQSRWEEGYDIKTVIIQKGITNIGDHAFSYCESITDITIPDSVTRIEEDAFGFCKRLTSITIPDSVTSIEEDAFASCESLTSITIPDSVTSIKNGTFSRCASLTDITIPSSVTSIGNDAFLGCKSLTSITIPDSVTSIGWDAFCSCTGLTNITIPDSVTTIGNYAFDGCKRLTIHGKSGSYAEQYAKDNNITFEAE